MNGRRGVNRRTHCDCGHGDRMPLGGAMRATLLLVLLSMGIPWVAPCYADNEEASTTSKNNDASQKELDGRAEDAAPKPLNEVVEKCERLEGLFTLLRDRETGEVYLQVRKGQLNQPFIYFTYVESGVSRFHLFRGNFRDERIFRIARDFQRLRFSFQPTRHYFSATSPLRFSADANVSPAVLAAEKIVAWDDDRETYLVSADNLFLGEVFHQVKPAGQDEDKSHKEFQLGALSREKSRFAKLKSYPQNTDLVVEYVYEDRAPKRRARDDEGVTDSRYITIKVQHSLISAPDNDFQPRRDDARVGYFTRQIDDMTSTSATPYGDVICRWHLKPQNPDAELSRPMEPIVWWLERTTPREFREIIRNAVLAWNEAFEQAGFQDALEVRVQPDEANWDAGDLRYNVLRWTSSPDPVFGGYGPSFVDPRSGQILGADIMLEWAFVTNRVKYQRLFRRDPAIHQDGHGMFAGHTGCFCNLAEHLQAATLLGRQVMLLRGATRIETDEIMKQALYFLMLHEIGHTLGLSHNFKSSQLHDPDQIHDADRTAKLGLTGSVMEYPSINLAPLDQPQEMYYTVRSGPYDEWAIGYGYSRASKDPAVEEERLQKILERSTEPELAFANDADDMRRPGRGIDPRAMIYDMTSDPISWADSRIQLLDQVADQLLVRYDEPGKSYHELRDHYLLLLFHRRSAARVVSRYIGGVYVDRATVGQPGATRPYQPVGREDQRRAMRILAERVFASTAFQTSPDLLAHLQPQRRGFDHFKENEDLRFHELLLETQRDIFDHLLHPHVLRRITDARTYGNDYRLDEFFADLTAAVFDDDLARDVNSRQQNLQTEYVKRLVKVLHDKKSETDRPHGTSSDRVGYDYLAQAMALHHLKQIRAKIGPVLEPTNTATLAHRGHLHWMIDRVLAVVQTDKRQ